MITRCKKNLCHRFLEEGTLAVVEQPKEGLEKHLRHQTARRGKAKENGGPLKEAARARVGGRRRMGDH